MTKEELFKYIKCYFEEIISEIYDLDPSDHSIDNLINLIDKAIDCTVADLLYEYYCFNYGWSHTTRDEITRIPFGGNSLLMRDDLNAK